MVRSSQVSPLDIQIKKRPADIFIPHLPKPTHYPFFIICILFAFFSPPRWGERSGNSHENPRPPPFMCLASLRTWEIYHFFMLLCLLWLTLIIKVYNHYRAEYIIIGTFFTPLPLPQDMIHISLCLQIQWIPAEELRDKEGQQTEGMWWEETSHLNFQKLCIVREKRWMTKVWDWIKNKYQLKLKECSWQQGSDWFTNHQQQLSN